MKKLLYLIGLSCFLFASEARAFDAFQMTPLTETAKAGESRVVDFVATQGGGQDLAYNGTGVLTATHATLGVIPISPSTVPFVAGIADNISVTITRAGEVDISIADSVLTSITSWAGHMTVGANAINHFTVLYHQGQVMRVTQPGASAPGYIPTWLTVTAGAPCAVSIVAMDQFNNITPIGATITVQDNYSQPIWSDVQWQTNGIAGYSWTPNPPAALDVFSFWIIVDSTFGSTPIWGNGVSEAIPTTYYIWITPPSPPTTVYAGTPFSVQVSASDSNLSNNPQPSANNYYLQIYPLLVTSAPGNGTLSPGNITIGTDGTKTQNFTYTRAETIYLDVSKISPTGPATRTIERAYSPLITVVASAPAQISASASPGSIQAQRTAVISATVVDAWQNPVSTVPVSFSITQGSSGNSLSAVTAQTNASGVAQVTLTGGITNETVVVQCRTNTLIANASIRVSVAPPDGGTMINYPNPFDPNQQKTSLNYYLNNEAEVEIRIYDAFGRVVLAKDVKPGQGTGDFANANLAGGANFLWDGKNGEGRVVANGIYLVKVKAKTGSGTQEFKRRVGVIK